MKNKAGLIPFENLCRICSSQTEKDKLISVFENDDLLEKITSCLPITIHEEDSLPHGVCEVCYNRIETSFQLVHKAQSSEKYFFSCLSRNGQVEGTLTTQPEDKLDSDSQQTLSLVLDGEFQCDVCGEQLSEALHLDNHIQEKHVNQSLPPNTEFTINKICSLCGQLFDSDENYVLHKCESHHKCLQCKKAMPTKCLLNRHIQHSCKLLYFCPHCHKTFSVKTSFTKHMQTHSGEEYQGECLACSNNLQGSGEFMQHTCVQGIIEGSKSAKKFKCYICGQAYKRQLNLARHCLQHEPKSKWKFKCQHCDEVFEKEKTLRSHYEKIHNMPKSWVCRFCGKSLSTKLSVQIHERIHTQVKPYVCEWCGNAFRCRPNLIQHQAMHNGIRNHKCTICEKKFSRPFFLKTHMRVHTGERPFQCDLCGKRFTQATDMRRHRKRHEKLANQQQQIVQQPTVIYVHGTEEELLPDVMYDLPIETVELKIETSYE